MKIVCLKRVVCLFVSLFVFLLNTDDDEDADDDNTSDVVYDGDELLVFLLTEFHERFSGR